MFSIAALVILFGGSYVKDAFMWIKSRRRYRRLARDVGKYLATKAQPDKR